ncbi:hypothetical protein FKM82_013481 [Ascaphus truei]
MKNPFATICCGMSPKNGSMVSGVYMILVCIMQSIFGRGHLRDALNRLTSAEQTEEVNYVSGVIPYYYYTYFVLVGITFCMCLLLLYSAYKQLFKGLLVYLAWIFFYEFLSIILLALTDMNMKYAGLSVRVMEKFGLSIRIVLHFFWLAYIVTYVLELINAKVRPTKRRRRTIKVRRKSKQLRLPPTFKFTTKVGT